MASNDFFGFKEDEQEGGGDATSTGINKDSAIDSSVTLIGTRDEDAIRKARLRAMKKDPDDIMLQVQGTREGTVPVVPITEQLGSMFKRFGEAIARGTGDVAQGMAVSRQLVDNPDYMVDQNLDFAHMSPAEMGEVAKKMQGKSPEEQRKIRMDEYTAKRDKFIAAANAFSTWMPDVSEKKTKGVLGVLDDAMSGMAQFAPTMAAGAASLGLMTMPVAYLQMMPGKYEEYTKAGLSKERAFKYAQAAGVALAAVETIGTGMELSKFGSAFSKKSVTNGFLRKFADQVISNARTEGIEELTQAEIEVFYDVAAKNPDATPEEVGKKVVAILKDPEFQKGAGYQALIGGVGGGVMGGTAAVASEIGNKINHRIESEGPGNHIVVPDEVDRESESIVDNPDLPADARPSVKNLMGIDSSDSDVEAPIPESGKGTTLSSNLNTPPVQAATQLKTNVAIESVLEEMNLRKSMQSDKIDIINNQNKLDQLHGLFVDAVEVGDHQEALTLAEQFKKTADDSSEKLLNFTDAKTRRLNKDKKTLNPKALTDVNVYIDDITRKAGDMVNGQVTAIKQQEAQQFMDFSDSLRDDPQALKSALVKQETTANNLKKDSSKLYRTAADLLDKQRWMTDEEMYGKAVKKDKLLEVMGDLERKIDKDEGDVRVPGTEKAVDSATLEYLTQLMVNKTSWDTEQARIKRVQAEYRAGEKAQRFTSTVTPQQERQARIKKQAEVARAKQEEQARAREQKQQADMAKKNTELAKRRRAIQEQAARTRKVPAEPTPEERKAELEASRKRKTEIEKQKKFVEEIDKKSSTIKEVNTRTDAQRFVNLQKRSKFNAVLSPANTDKIVSEIKSGKRKVYITANGLGGYSITKDGDLQMVVSNSALKGSGKKLIADAIKNGAKTLDAYATKDKRGKEFLPELYRSFGFVETSREKFNPKYAPEGWEKTILKERPDVVFMELNGKPAKSDLNLNKEQYQLSNDEVKRAETQYRSAAIQYKGKVYEGASHTSILMQNDALTQALLDTPTHLIHATFDHGFVTHDGKFDDRMSATKKLGLKKGNYLQSENFLEPVLDTKAELLQKGDNKIDIANFDELPLSEKMGTLELADKIREEMKTGEYSWLFDKTNDLGVETVLITDRGQYGKNETVKRFYPDLKSKDAAVSRFEGALRPDPRTGQMKPVGGVKGVYLKANPMKGNLGGKAFINLQNIAKNSRSIKKAMETLVHEHIHGLVDHGVRNLTPAQTAALNKELQDLWDSIPTDYVREVRDDPTTHERIGNGIIQIMRDGIGELVTYSFAHPEFAEWLDTIPASPKFRAKSSKIKTLWDALVDLVKRRVLKVPTKHDELVDIMNRHLDFSENENPVRFSKANSGRAWKNRIEKYLNYTSENNNASAEEIVKATGLTQYEVGNIQQLLNENNQRFSKENTNFNFGANVTPEHVKSWVSTLDEAAANALPTEVVANAAEAEKILGFKPGDTAVSFWIPESQTEKPYGAKKSWKPTTNPGRVVLIADRIESEEHAISKWMHEQVGHQGLHNVFPTKHSYESFMSQAFGLFSIKDSKTLNDIIELYDIGKKRDNGTRKLTFKDRVHAAEEVIGTRAETLSPTVKKGLVAKFKAFLRRWLPKVFVGKKNEFKLKDDDVWNIIRMARENVFTGNTKFGELLQKALDARAPKVKFQGWKTLPNFMLPDEEYKNWAKQVRKEAPQQVKWYTQHKDTLLRIFGKDADLFNILLSVTSPNADVESNVLFAAKTYAYLMGATDKPGALYVNKLKTRIDEHWTSPESMYRNLESNLFKVTEFVRGLMGDPEATVGDMWMYRAFFGDPLSNNQKEEKFSVPQTVAMRQKLHDLAAQLSDETGETWTPREVQAAIWVHINAAQTGKSIGQIATYESGFNKPTKVFDGKTPLEWLQDLFPNMRDGIASKRLGLKEIPMAPLSPLEKKLLGQIDTELKAKKSKPGYTVDDTGVITITPSENKRIETVRMMRAIVAGGREVVVNDDITGEWLRQTFGFQRVDKPVDGKVTMRLRPDAEKLFTSPKQKKVTFAAIRDNLGGFSGTYTQEVRFSREAKRNLEQIRDMSTDQIDAEWLKTGNDGASVLDKIHEWRDQSELNWNRFTTQLEQEFLDKFGGRKSRVLVLGTGRRINTADTELLQKAMNLYIDSGKGSNLEKVQAYVEKLRRKLQIGQLTNREREHLDIIARMDNMSSEEKAWADSTIRPYYEDSFKFAQDNDLIDSHVDNYVKRSWELPKHLKDADVRWSGNGMTGFTLTPDSGKQRSLDSIVDGWENGMDLKTEGVISNLQNYGNELGYTFANRRFVNYMRGLIDFSADGLMFEVDPKKQPDFKLPAGFVRITDRGFAKPGRTLYARADIGKAINKLGERPTWSLWEIPGIKALRIINSSIKSTIFTVSLFHHLAGIRSYIIGVNGKKTKLGPFKAFRRGLARIDEQSGFDRPGYEHLGPMVDYLVQEGLTLGRTQDWEETALQQSVFENILRKGKSKASYSALKSWQAARRTKRSLTVGLFNSLFAGLKAEAASFEFGHALKKLEEKAKKEGRGLTNEEIKLAAKQTAAIVNADFGGLHLKRMGRNPDMQRIAQLLLLAPDWTESNWRTVVGMIPGAEAGINKLIGDSKPIPGMGKVYRRFWKGVALRGIASVVLANAAAMALFADDDEREDYFNFLTEQLSSWKNFVKGRWLGVPIDPILPKSWVDPNKRRVVSVLGHFKDILKAGRPIELARGKTSPVGRMALTAIEQKDWKGARFTTLSEIFEDGVVPKLVADNPWDLGDGGVTLPSWLAYNVRQSVPIFGSELIQAMAGESSWIASLSRTGGLDVRDVRRVPIAQKKFEEINQEVNKLQKNLDTARKLNNKEMKAKAQEDIDNFDGFNRTKSRLGFTKTQIAYVNKQLKPLKLKEKNGITLTDGEQEKMRKLNQRKQEIYEKALEVIGR